MLVISKIVCIWIDYLGTIFVFLERITKRLFPATYAAFLGESVTLKCLSDEIVTWKFYGGNRIFNTNEMHTAGSRYYSLQIEKFSKANTGMYSCDGEDYGLGIAFIDFAYLQLHGKLP